MAVKKVLQIMIVLLCSIDAILFVQAAGLTINSSSCQAFCGDVSIPYPFGIGAGCYVDHWFEVVCNDSFSTPKPFLSSFGLEVLTISLEDAYRFSRSTVRVNYPTFSICTYNSTIIRKQNVELANSSFFFSRYENIFVAMGCDNSASMRSSDGSIIGECKSRCDSSEVVIHGSNCDATNCCQTTIASDLDASETTVDPIINVSESAVTKQCNSAFLVEEGWFCESGLSINMSSIMSHVPVVLEWGIPETSFYSLQIAKKTGKEYMCYNRNYISHGKSGSDTCYCSGDARTCYCTRGFAGNPYLVGGCQGKVFIAVVYFISLILPPSFSC
jgi:hypothetical protein